MRILHTSDWHLGHTLHGLTRDVEHARFLQWLLELLARERPDALLITGDVFETQNPPARAERAWFDFLALARQARPGLSILVIAGNHDAPARLEAPAPLLLQLGVTVIGSARDRSGELDPERLVVPLPLADRPAEVGAWVAAVPFLRPSDLPPAPEGVDPERAEGEQVRALYSSVFAAARARRRPGQALLATGHLPFGLAPGGASMAGSERPVHVGYVRGLPLDLFPEDLDYVALGHIHRPQALLGREAVRYAGSPIPLSMAERDYPHQVVVVDLAPGAPARVRPALVPRAVELLRLPAGEPGAPDEVLALLAALPAAGDEPADSRPFLEVRLRIAGPDATLRRRIEEAIQGKAVRLVKLSLEREEVAPGDGSAARSAGLSELAPLEVLRRCWERERGQPPSPELEAAYLELVAEAEAEARQDESLPPAPSPRLFVPASPPPAREPAP